MGEERVLVDAFERRSIEEDLDDTLFVEAAAGTGKTSALVSRMVSLLRRGVAELVQIVGVTFTEKAAGEMKLRLRGEIEKARNDVEVSAEERARLDTALHQLELARIGTIHSFCGDLLRERPVEACVDPLYEVTAEDAASGLLDRAFDAWFECILADPPEGVRRVLRRRPRRFGDRGPRAALRAAVDALVQHRDFEATWRRDPFDRESAIDALLSQFDSVAPLAVRAGRSDDYLARSFERIGRFADENRLREAVRGRDYDGLEAELRDFASGRERHWRWTGGKRRYAEDLEREEALAARDGVKAALDALLAACDADLAPRLQAELRPVVAAYEEAKRRAGALDFLDLLVRARDLVRDDGKVRAEFQARFTHFFVDEFQDTDPLQAEILLLLAADDPDESDWRKVVPKAGKLFIVGDPKQSIYRFRRADVALYEEVKQRLAAAGARVLELSTSFRGLPSIQAAVNATFAQHMKSEAEQDRGTQAAYVALESFRADVSDRPSVVVLPVPRPYGDYGTMVKWKIEDSFPDAVGAFVHWLVEKSGWQVEEPDNPGKRVEVAARHVCLLFRRFQSFGEDVTRGYVRALEARRVPHVLVGGRSFHEREEVLAVRNALCAIEWPEDDLRVFATLRGPFFALADAALLAFRHRVGGLHPLRRLTDEIRESLTAAECEVAEALAVLARLHSSRNRRPVADTISRLFNAVRAHAGVAIWPTGEQALANCLRTIELARRFERGGAASFRAFVEWLEAEAESGQAQDAPVVEEGTEGVRIMTVHRAKGLEFPVVILVDPTCNATGGRPSRHVDPERGLWAEPLCGSIPPDLRDAEEEELRRDREESVRLAYVAATRARDLLVVAGLGDCDAGDEIAAGWADVLHGAVYPTREARRARKPAPGCPDFGEDSVFERPARVRTGRGGSIAPGLHRPQNGAHSVVWWDPAVLALDVKENVGLRQESILVADESGAVAEESERSHTRWQEARAATLARGCTPSLRVQSVTALAERGSEPAAEEPATSRKAAAVVRVALTDADRDRRPGGARFGTLVHAILATVDLKSSAAVVRVVARTQGRLGDATTEEVSAAAEAVIAALAHPLLERAARSSNVRRETPILLREAEGGLAEGVVDLAFREEEGGVAVWTVVDFKTDRDLSAQQARYEAQVGLYLDAVSAATGARAEGYLLVV